MTKLPPFMLARPPMPTDPATLAAFEALYARAIANEGREIAYDLPAPRWQFLCYLSDTHPVLLHGSGNSAISRFEPRKSDDVNAFGDQRAVYAASDGLWPMYFAILDRERFPMTLINSSARLVLGDGGRSDPCYFFSISRQALDRRPFRGGTIYLLPRDGFIRQAGMRYRGLDIEVMQWASLVPVKPMARLSVGPEDFPLLDRIRGHDDAATFARARANPDGFPWLDESDPT